MIFVFRFDGGRCGCDDSDDDEDDDEGDDDDDGDDDDENIDDDDVVTCEGKVDNVELFDDDQICRPMAVG